MAKEIATANEIAEELAALDLTLLIQSLVRYAQSRMRGSDYIEAEIIVGNVLEKVVNGERRWNKEYSFKSFIFLAVRSLVSQRNQSFDKGQLLKLNRDYNLEDVKNKEHSDRSKTEELVRSLIKILERHRPPPDEIELMIFESWTDNIVKPREIADLWEIEIGEVRNGIKRLKRKLGPIKDHLTTLIYG